MVGLVTRMASKHTIEICGVQWTYHVGATFIACQKTNTNDSFVFPVGDINVADVRAIRAAILNEANKRGLAEEFYVEANSDREQQPGLF